MEGCLAWVVVLALDFLATAGLLGIGCWLLSLIGVTVVWSWLLSFVVWGVIKIIKIIF